MNCKEEELVGVSYHPNWLTFARSSTNQSDSPRVLTYINIQISNLCFSLQNDILNHRDVSCIFFFNQGSIFFLINIYSDSSQSVLKYLKDTETNICNVIIITRDFNIRDSLWNLNFPFYSVHSDILFDIADSFSIALSKPTENFPTRFLDNDQNSNSVLDLIFTRPLFIEFNYHHIHPDWRLIFDHALITVNIPIGNEYIPTKLSELQEVNLVLFSFSSYFLFSFLSYFSFSLFLAPRIRVSNDIGHTVQRRF